MTTLLQWWWRARPRPADSPAVDIPEQRPPLQALERLANLPVGPDPDFRAALRLRLLAAATQRAESWGAAGDHDSE